MAPSKTRIGLYPGTFDPITLGHIDIIKRAAGLVDQLVIGVAKNDDKAPLFDVRARVKMVENEVGSLKNVSVKSFDNLLLNFAKSLGASIIIRGLRGAPDFEYEIHMAAMNKAMNPKIETVFLPASVDTRFISSHFVKEIARHGGNVKPFVTPPIVKRLTQRLKRPSGP